MKETPKAFTSTFATRDMGSRIICAKYGGCQLIYMRCIAILTTITCESLYSYVNGHDQQDVRPYDVVRQPHHVARHRRPTSVPVPRYTSVWSGGSGVLPRIRSAAFSAIIIVGA